MPTNNDTQAVIGVALGGGGAKGWSHIGVINALEQLGIRPSIVAGTSMGALVGAAYASDRLNKLEKWARPMTWKDMLGYLDVSISGGGLLQGEKLLKAMEKEAFDNGPMEKLPKIFGAVATRLHDGEEIWLKAGPLLEGVRASIALPGLFTPVKHENHWLVDGGLVNPVPVSLCRALGADIIIAVNLYDDIEKQSPPEEVMGEVPAGSELALTLAPDEETNLWDKVSNQIANGIQEGKEVLLTKVLQRKNDMPGVFEVFTTTVSIMQNRLTRILLDDDPPDIMLSPGVTDIGIIDFHKADMAIVEGEKSVFRKRAELEELIRNL